MLEAIRAMFGCLPGPAQSLFATPAAQGEDHKDRKRRVRAWLLASSEAKRQVAASQVHLHIIL